MSPIACLYTVALLFIISVMASRNNVFLQRDLALFFSETCLKSEQNHWWLLKNGASALFSISVSSEELQCRIPFFTVMWLFCEKTFDGKVGINNRTLRIFHGLGSQSTVTCISQLPGSMSLGQTKKRCGDYCSSVNFLWIAMTCIAAGWMSYQPGLDQHSEGHTVQGCRNIPMWLPILRGTEQPHWKRLRKADPGGQIKTTDVSSDVARWLENLIGLGSFSAFCCEVFYLGRKMWIIFPFFLSVKIKACIYIFVLINKNKWTDNIIVTIGQKWTECQSKLQS